jgi:acyl-CoA reductase-like NAD-dependent aldehyde dehydrogenase
VAAHENFGLDIDVKVAAVALGLRTLHPARGAWIVAPWNYPYLTSVNGVIPALMAGNAVILKHSAQTPLCAEGFQQAFDAAGLPKGLFQHLVLTHEDTAKVIGAPEVAYCNFTGSVSGGHAVQQAALGKFMGLGLELGGKDPAYVRADANLDHAVENLVDGAMFNSGQCCCAIERIYVHEKLFDKFVDGFADLTKKYKLGNPMDPNTNLDPMRPLLITDPGLANLPMIKEAIERNNAAGVPTGLFSNIQGNRTGKNVEDGIAAYKAGGHDGVIAFGGGSALGANGVVVAGRRGQARGRMPRGTCEAGIQPQLRGR